MNTVIVIDERVAVIIFGDEPQTAAKTTDVPSRFDSDAEFARWLNEEEPDGHYGWADMGNMNGDAYTIAIATERPVHRDQMDALAHYYFTGEFAGEYDGLECLDEVQGWGRLFLLAVDTTKSRRDDIGDALPGIWPHFQEGSPIRKTDRAGAGTRGTRAVDGIRCDLWVAFR